MWIHKTKEECHLKLFDLCVSTHTDVSGHRRECEVINEADDEDTLYRVATPSLRKGDKGKDFILLASRRKPCDARCFTFHYISF